MTYNERLFLKLQKAIEDLYAERAAISPTQQIISINAAIILRQKMLDRLKGLDQ